MAEKPGSVGEWEVQRGEWEEWKLVEEEGRKSWERWVYIGLVAEKPGSVGEWRCNEASYLHLLACAFVYDSILKRPEGLPPTVRGVRD